MFGLTSLDDLAPAQARSTSSLYQGSDFQVTRISYAPKAATHFFSGQVSGPTSDVLRAAWGSSTAIAKVAVIEQNHEPFSLVSAPQSVEGVDRADTPERKGKRQKFVEELLTAIPIHPVSVPLALRTAQIDGENQA
jgi:hypothetical protein